MCVHTYGDVLAHVWVCACTYVRMCLHRSGNVLAQEWVYMCTCMSMCVHMYGYVCARVGLYAQFRRYRNHRVANALWIQALIGAQGTETIDGQGCGNGWGGENEVEGWRRLRLHFPQKRGLGRVGRSDTSSGCLCQQEAARG